MIQPVMHHFMLHLFKVISSEYSQIYQEGQKRKYNYSVCYLVLSCFFLIKAFVCDLYHSLCVWKCRFHVFVCV